MRQISLAARLTLLAGIGTTVAAALTLSVGLNVAYDAMADRALSDVADLEVGYLETAQSGGVTSDELIRELGSFYDIMRRSLDSESALALVKQVNDALGREPGDPLLVYLQEGLVMELTDTGPKVRQQRTDDGYYLTEFDGGAIGSYLAIPAPARKPLSYRLKRRVLSNGADVVFGYDVTSLKAGVRTARRGLAVLAVPFVALITLLTWLVARRTLKPVARMTQRVAEISAIGPLAGERLPVPETRDDIARLGVQMNDLLDRISAGAVAQRAFTSDAGHELRSPLAVLRSDHEQALADGGAVGALALRTLSEIVRLERVVDDLLDLSRIDERSGARWSREVDVDDVVLTEAARRRRVAVSTTGLGAGRVHGDPDSVRRIVQHLLDNATRHATSTVACGLVTSGGAVVLSVDDDGPGIAPGDRVRIFDRFVRLDEARSRAAGGSGLGLSVVAELVREMGGAVVAEESPLGGARFTIRWPETMD